VEREERNSWIVKIIAIVCLTIINIVALLHGIDSTLTGTISAIIGGIAGYEIGRKVVGKK